MDKKIFLAGFLLLLLGAANAVQITGDFSLSTDCLAPGRATYVLSNDSGRAQTYSIRAVGENADWINLNGKWVGEEALTIRLGSNESAEIYAFVKPQTCYVEPGDYTVTIEISNGEEISREIDVEVVESRAIEIEIEPEKAKVAQCKETVFEIELENLGERGETALLSVEGLPLGWASLEASQVYLQKGQAKTVELEVQPACDAKTGEYSFLVKASVEGTSFSTEESGLLEIGESQGIEITAQSLTACPEKETARTVKIKNTGQLEDSLQLSIEGLDKARVQPSQLALKPGEEKEISLVFSKGIEEGSQDFAVKAYSAKFDKTTEQQLSVAVSKCYSLAVESVLLDSKEPGEKPVLCLESKPVYTFFLKNDATETVEADVRLAGLDSVLSPSILSVEPGKTEEVSVQLDLKNELPGDKLFSFQISGKNFSLQHGLEAVSVDCFNLQVEWNGLEEPVSLDANCKSEPFTVNVRNNGTESQVVSVSVAGPDWIYFEPEQVELGQGEEKQVYFYFSPPYDAKQGRHQAVVSIKDWEKAYEKEIEMNVGSTVQPEPPEPAPEQPSISTKAEVEEIVESLERTVKISLLLSNDGNAALDLNSIATKYTKASFDFEGATLLPAETIEVPMTLHLGSSDENRFSITLLISTAKVTMQREIEIDLEGEPEEEPVVPVGLFGLAGLGDLVIAGLVIVIIVVFAAIALSAEIKVRRKESGLKHLAEEVKELPGKKLEEIGKHKKQENSKNLHEIVKQVKKKHSAKKPAKKRASKKR